MKIKFLFYIAYAKVFKDFKMICMETSDTLKKMYTKDKKVEINEHYTPKKKKSYTIYINIYIYIYICIKWLTIFLFVNNIYKQNPVEWLCLTLNIVQNVVNRGYKQDYENWNT